MFEYSFLIRQMRLAVPAAVLSAECLAAHAQEWKEPDSPFTIGEAQPAQEATCETARRWIDHAPDVDARITFAITGKLTAVHWDGALAYLIMCEDGDVQVMCVTYSKEGRKVGETVSFAGGYVPAQGDRIILDPCLASEE